jgi:IS5 family transposase
MLDNSGSAINSSCQSYKRMLKKLSTEKRFKHTKQGAKGARKAGKKIKIIAGRLVREIARKLPLAKLGIYLPALKLYQRVLFQKRGDTNKIYSFHEPDVKCYAKGKEYKKFEFGSKASILIDQATGIIMGAINFTQTLHDSKTLPEVLEQYERLNGKQPEEVFVDRGYKGTKQYKQCSIYVPQPDKNITKDKRKKHSKRAAIEPVIGHLKQHYRFCRNYLKGILGDNMNLLLAAAAMNFKRQMNRWRKAAIHLALLIFNYFIAAYRHFIAKNMEMTF